MPPGEELVPVGASMPAMRTRWRRPCKRKPAYSTMPAARLLSLARPPPRPRERRRALLLNRGLRWPARSSLRPLRWFRQERGHLDAEGLRQRNRGATSAFTRVAGGLGGSGHGPSFGGRLLNRGNASLMLAPPPARNYGFT